MASNYTENYGLCQWEATDQVLRTEFNEDNMKVDATLLEHGQKLQWLGDLRMECGSYVGTGKFGEENANSITFTAKPMAVLIGGGGSIGILMEGNVGISASAASTAGLNCIISGNTIHWWHGSIQAYQLNSLGYTYKYIGLLKKD